MSDRDIQGNTDSKPNLTPNTQSQTDVKEPKVQNVVFDEIPSLPEREHDKEPTIDFFGQNEMEQDKPDPNPFGKSINKETLQETKKMIADEEEDYPNRRGLDMGDNKPKHAPPKKMNLGIEIDENEDYDTAHKQA